MNTMSQAPQMPQLTVNAIVAQQIRDLAPRPIPFVQPMTGIQQHCYSVGQEHAQLAMPDPVGEGIAALPCTLSTAANQAYTQGFIDGLGL